jgi:multisubunit Na+/H+ antiporter MnhB subunit
MRKMSAPNRLRFVRLVAWCSLLAPLVTLTVADLVFRWNRVPGIAVGTCATLAYATGLVLGLCTVRGTLPNGRKTTFWQAVAGIALNAILLIVAWIAWSFNNGPAL